MKRFVRISPLLFFTVLLFFLVELLSTLVFSQLLERSSTLKRSNKLEWLIPPLLIYISYLIDSMGEKLNMLGVFLFSVGSVLAFSAITQRFVEVKGGRFLKRRLQAVGYLK